MTREALSPHRIEANKKFWSALRKKYGTVFCAEAANVRPENVDHLFSAPFSSGMRTFAFGTEIDRDKFVAEYNAEPCGEPV